MANLTFLRESLADHTDDDVRSALSDTDLALTRAAGIVRSMKMVVRASATDAPADLSSVALDAVIEQVLAEITAARGGRRLPVSLAGDPGLHVRADGARLGQIIANLVENALHASDGSPVVIARKAAGQRESRESLSSIVDVGSVELRISDQGPGMSPAVARAREPFFSTKGPGEGTGLGLAVVDGLVHGLGGELAIDSRLGEGTEVRVTLPRGDAEREDVPDDSRLPRVLVVDDDPLVLRAISRTLSRVAEVTTADGVREALACLRGAEFDAIVSDVVMPEGGGQALYDALDPRQRRSVVFITAAAADPTVAAFLRGQERPVLEKPLDAEQLRQIVMQLGTSAPASVVRRRNDEIPGDTAATS